MSPADAAHIAPFLTHEVSHHGQITLIPADNNGRVRKAKPKRGRGARQDRPTRADEEPRFNVGPRSTRPALTAQARNDRRLGRGVRTRPEEYNDDFSSIPDYPPPSFMEAMSTPALSLASTTTVNVLAHAGPAPVPPISPLPAVQSSAHITPSRAREPEPPLHTNCPPEDAAAASNSDSDSLEIVEADPSQEQMEAHPPHMIDRFKKDGRWHRAHAVDAPPHTTSRPDLTVPHDDNRGRVRQISRREVFDSDQEDAGSPVAATPPPRRHLSLSPLRTLLPKTWGAHEHLSAHPTANSPYSFARPSSPSFLKSTTSLRLPLAAASFCRLPFSSSSTSSPSASSSVAHKLFKQSGKEKERESIDSWEVIDREPVPSLDNKLKHKLAHPMPSSPLSAPVSAVSPSSNSSSPLGPSDRSVQSPAQMNSTPDIHPLSMRDRKAPPPPPPARKARRPPPPPPVHTGQSNEASASAPVVDRSPPPIITIRTKKPPPPPLPLAAAPSATPVADDAQAVAIFQRALEVPLPLTPHTPSTPEAAGGGAHSALVPSTPTRSALSHSFVTPIRQEHYHAAPLAHQISSVPPSPSDATVTPTRRHYPGRPLPRPPGSAFAVDSVYASHDGSPMGTTSGTEQHCPEGLLIDFGETPSASDAHSSTSSLNEIPTVPPSPALDVPVAPVRGVEPPAPLERPLFSEYTDLDVLVSQLGDGPGANDYDALLRVAEFVGPAGNPRNNAAKPQLQEAMQGTVAVSRRRVTADGRVKLKLMLLNKAVDRCGICMSQFREGSSAALGARCGHAFHVKCATRWLETCAARSCPLCRAPLDA